jgi:hypothetical protein
MHDNLLWRDTAVLVLAVLFGATPAFAYIGPGLGVGAIIVALAVLGSILLGMWGTIYYPVKRMIRKLRKGRDAAA